MSLVTPEICKTIDSGYCVDPKTGLDYPDKTVRCSLLNSGTPGEYLCKQLLQTPEAIEALSKEICAAEPNLLECGRSTNFTMFLFILGGAFVVIIIIVILTRQRENY
jgi:hypothetical protein